MAESTPTALIPWRLATGLFAVAGLLLLFLHFAEIDRLVSLAREARPVWLLAALALQFMTYFCLAQGWKGVLGRSGHDVALAKLVPVALMKLFADQAMPSAGIGGHIVTIGRMRALGVPRPEAMGAVLLTLIGYYLSYAVCALAMLVIMWLASEVSRWLAGVVTLFLVVAVAVPSLALWVRRRGAAPLPAWLEGIGPARRVLHLIGTAPAELLRRPGLIVRVTLWNGLIYLLDAASLSTCLLALGASAHPTGAFVALIMASIASTLSPMPMGLGTFEATSVTMLTMTHIPLETAVAATLLLRGLTLWLPLLPGLVLLRGAHEEKGDDRD